MNQCLEDMKASTQHSTLPLPLPISSTSHLDRYPMRHIRFGPTYAHLQADQKGSQKGRPRPHGKAFPTGRTTSAHEQPPKKNSAFRSDGRGEDHKKAAIQRGAISCSQYVLYKSKFELKIQSPNEWMWHKTRGSVRVALE